MAQRPGRASLRTPGERIDYVRRLAGLNWAELGARAKLHRGTLWQACNRSGDPRISTLVKVADAMSVDAAWLAFGTGEKPTKEALRVSNQ